MKCLRFNGKIIIAFKNRSIVLEPISRAKFPPYAVPEETPAKDPDDNMAFEAGWEDWPTVPRTGKEMAEILLGHKLL